jgi:hypothetical protein
MVDPEEAEAVVGVFKRYEELDEELAEDSARRFARSCLVHLFSKNPSQSLLDFLKSPIGIQTKEQEDAAGVVGDAHDVPPGVVYPGNLPQVLVDLVVGKDTDEHLNGFPPELATFITGLQSAKQGKIKQATEAADALLANSMLRSQLEQFIRQQEAMKATSDISSRGLQIADPEFFEGSFDDDRDEILAYCTKADSPKAVFVHPVAVVRSGRIQLLSAEKRQELFPETGDVMAFIGVEYPRQPRRGEVGIWRVAEHRTDRATRYHLASERRPVYEVRSVPFNSMDYDSVREFLKEYAERSSGVSLQPLLFHLNDGLIIGGRTERLDLSKDELYESGLLSWHSLQAMRLEGRLFVVGPLPKEQGIYECAGLASTVRKLFRSLVGSEKVAGGLTKAQLSYLAQSLGSVGAELDALRVQRIKSQLERLGEQREALDALVDVLMNHASVQQRINQLVEQEASTRLERKGSLQTDIIRLQKDRGEWEDRVRKQREEYRKLPDGIAKAIKAAFEKARANGLSTLAEVAIFQALSVPAQTPGTVSEVRAGLSGSFAQPTVRDLMPTGGAVVTTLRALGVSAQQATAFDLVGEVARRAGLMICVRGVAARPAVEGWARSIMLHGVLVDSTIGMIDDAVVRSVLAREPAPDLLTLLDANLSALDMYARPLSDLVLARLAEPTASRQLAIFLSLADGVGALPLPRTFERVSVLIDLDKRYTFHNASDMDELMSEATNPDDGTLYARLWRPAADRLRMQIDELESEQRALVLSVLVAK